PDRAVELKERMAADEADRRISRGALGLARLYTNKIDDTVRARLYLNLDSPVVQRLATEDSPAHGSGAAMLKALAAVLASHRDTATESDLSGALREVTRALETLLDLAKGEH
ncbi:MAG: molecular chaperone HtpG, partial [Myxococcota bacterium]